MPIFGNNLGFSNREKKAKLNFLQDQFDQEHIVKPICNDIEE